MGVVWVGRYATKSQSRHSGKAVMNVTRYLLLLIFAWHAPASFAVEFTDIERAYLEVQPEVPELPKLIRPVAARHLEQVRRDLPEVRYPESLGSASLFSLGVSRGGRNFEAGWGPRKINNIESKGRLLFDGDTLAKVEVEVSGPLDELVQFTGNALCLLEPALAIVADEETKEYRLKNKERIERQEQESKRLEQENRRMGMQPISERKPITIDSSVMYRFEQQPASENVAIGAPAIYTCTSHWNHRNSEAILTLSWQTDSDQMTWKFTLVFDRPLRDSLVFVRKYDSVAIGDKPMNLLYRCLWDMRLNQRFPQSHWPSVSAVERLARPFLAKLSVDNYWRKQEGGTGNPEAYGGEAGEQ